MEPKQYSVEAYGSNEYADNPSFAVFEIEEATAQKIVRLAQMVKEHNIYKTAEFDYRVEFTFTGPDDEDDPGETIRIDCPTLNVTASDFYFKAYHKHISGGMESASQPIAELAAHFGIPFNQE